MLLVWTLFALTAAATFATYARLPPEELYHTSIDGLAGGASRTLVFLNFPTALVALGILPVVVERLLDRHPRAVAVSAAVAAPLCLLVAAPGVVQQADLDARPVNALPAAGVGIVVVLTAAALRASGPGHAPRAAGDPLRVVLAAVLFLIAIPWLFAELGFYAPDPFYADEPSPDEPLAAVHLGRHHGFDGVLLALAALALSRTLASFRHRRLARVASAYLALMLAYGLANALQDFILEQVYKRGWIDVRPPSVLLPEASVAWALLLAAAVLIEVLWFGRARYRSRSSAHSDIGT